MVAIYAAPFALVQGAVPAVGGGRVAVFVAGGFLADQTRRHDLVASTGMVFGAMFTLTVASGGIAAALLALVMGLAGFSIGVTSPSRDMLVRAATPRGASGKVFGFVYSGLDLGSLAAPPVYGWLLDRGEPRAMFVVIAVLMVVTIVTVVQVRRHALPAPA